MRPFILFLAVIATIQLSPASAWAERRLALVIGNAKYRLAGDLANPASDASAMAKMLRGIGFEVIEGSDLDRAGMQAAIGDFGKRLTGADIALFYYAGHGIQVDGENLLIPTDAEIQTESDLALATVPLRVVQQQMADAPRVKLIILDACRDNPFHDQLKRLLPPTRALSTPDGLAAVNLRGDVGGTFIAFATDPGAYAQDGHGQPNSPFTQALLRHMPRPGIELHEMMIDVRGDVWRATGEAQRPWSNSSLTGKVFLGPRRAEGLTRARPHSRPPGTGSIGHTAELAEVALWRAAERSTSAAAYHAYLDAYPKGVFAGLAELRLGALLDPADPAEIAVSEPGSTNPIPMPRPNLTVETPEAQTLALARTEIVTIQRNLQRLGFRPGKADGIFGPRTRAAVRGWQKSSGIPSTGLPDRLQLAQMAREASSAQVASLVTPTRPARVRTRRGHPEQPARGLIDQALHEIELNFRASASGTPPDPAVERLLRHQRVDAYQR